MLHLHAERLAALADEAPTPVERAHLDACPQCAGEVDSYRRLLERAAASRETPVGAGELQQSAPLTDWASLSVRMRSAGLLPPAEVVPFPVSGEFRAARRQERSSRVWPRVARRAAAAAVFLGAGAMIGRASAGEPLLPSFGESEIPAGVVASTPGSEDEALVLMAQAELQYRQAAAYLASMEGDGYVLDEPDVLQTRLAALDEVGAVTREALHAAPHDPVINQYYLAAQGARAATLRQMNQAGAPAMLVGSF